MRIMNHAKNVFEKFKCKNLLDYSILYLKTDICHLSDVFQKFSDFAYKTYELDPRHSFTLPGFSWQSMLKMTKIELELISDPDMYLFLMDTIRGGISVCNKKHVIADNKYIDENTKNNKYLMYLDANNLYGVSMIQSLPYKNFKWSNNLSLDEIQLVFMKLIWKFQKNYMINLKIIHWLQKLKIYLKIIYQNIKLI